MLWWDNKVLSSGKKVQNKKMHLNNRLHKEGLYRNIF